MGGEENAEGRFIRQTTLIKMSVDSDINGN
jgi:hypothetical protein